jgi:ABC-2 type transport system ATP-binding protein
MMKWFIKSPLKEPVYAVQSVDLQVQAGSIFGLIGANGAGKTTLIKMLCTLLWPTGGFAKVNGFDIKKDESQVRKNIGLVVAEERSFYWRLTGRQNLEFFATLYELDKAEAKKRIAELLELTGLTSSADSMFYGYSAGMKQKLAIARALMIRPKVLFLDEPTRSIDPITAKEIKTFLSDVLVREHGVSVLLTSHRLEDIEQLCDKIAVLNRGKILFDGTVGELRNVVGMRQCYEIVASCKKVDKLKLTLAGESFMGSSVESIDGNGQLQIKLSYDGAQVSLTDVLQDIMSGDGVIYSCERKDDRLEDIFIHMMKGVTSGE